MGEDEDNGRSSSLSLEQKRAAMLNRLSVKQDARLQKSAARKAGSAAEASPLESTQSFLDAFSDGCRSVEARLSSIQQQNTSSLSENQKASFKIDLDKLSLKLFDLEKLVADKAYFLPSYEVRTSQATIAALREQIEAALGELLPKKKFSFKNKAGKGRAAPEATRGTVLQAEEGAELDVMQLKGGNEDRAGVSKLQEEKNKAEENNSGAVMITGLSTCSIQHLEDRVVVRDLHDQEDGEVVLEDLINCKVYIRGRSQALYGHMLKGCQIYAGPVTGSVLIEEVEGCVLMLASHQIRIHHARATDLYLRVRSRPIVEYTEEVRVAPYSFSYIGIEDDLCAANLLEETGQWQQVDDFRWLRAVPSPNWSILPDHERLPPVEGTSIA